MAKTKSIDKLKFLMVIDAQNDFIDGVLGTKEAVKAIPNIKDKVKKYEKDKKSIIVYTMLTHYSGPITTMTVEGNNTISHCQRYSPGWGINPEVYSPKGSIIEKLLIGTKEWVNIILNSNQVKLPEGLQLPELFELLNNAISHIEVIGFKTDTGVLTNALFIREAFPTLDVVVDGSCCAGTTPEDHKAALRILENNFIRVIKGESK